ncbi:MAG: methylmalonyl Co-A mutase-associated GTPase MeaB [Pseudomonadota bacterium]
MTASTDVAAGADPVAGLIDGVRRGDRAALGQAITRVESTRPARRAEADRILEALLASTGGALRIGITGVPGVGKSTLIDQFGLNLIEAGKRVAVLAVDPTSQRTGGSILGDKTRMAGLSMSDQAYIRPSPTAGTLGGVANRTRETILLCEAAGFDVVIVETVGVGQSETTVAGMVDVFAVLVLPGGGDELQGIKKGVIELADILVINKADGDHVATARRTAADYQGAINLLSADSGRWRPPVLSASGLRNEGLDTLWETITEHQRVMEEDGRVAARRAEQRVAWLNERIEAHLLALIQSRPDAKAALADARDAVKAGTTTPTVAAQSVMAAAGLKS